MLSLRNIEFYGTPSGDVMISSLESPLKKYEPENRDFTSSMISFISEFYIEAFECLCEMYTPSKLNPSYFEFLIVHRFIRCNFSEYDRFSDIDYTGRFQFEHVKCPLRGECKYDRRICLPKFNTKLSSREIQVMQMFYENYDLEMIAETLFISVETVKNHKRNSLHKLRLKSLTEFATYASMNKLFT